MPGGVAYVQDTQVKNAKPKSGKAFRMSFDTFGPKRTRFAAAA